MLYTIIICSCNGTASSSVGKKITVSPQQLRVNVGGMYRIDGSDVTIGAAVTHECAARANKLQSCI